MANKDLELISKLKGEKYFNTTRIITQIIVEGYCYFENILPGCAEITEH